VLGKTPHKENSRPRAEFNGRYEVVQEEERTKGKGFRPQETLLRGGNGSIFHEVPVIYKMAALLFYHSPIFL
jgi:hypothetical protein